LTALPIGGGTLDADIDGMALVVPSRLRVPANAIGQPNLRLVARNRFRIAESAESPKTAVTACLTARSGGNGELLRKASAAAREHDGEFYAVLAAPRRARFGKAQVRALIEDAIVASYLGAKIVWLDSSDMVGGLIEFARQARIGRIFVAPTRPAPFARIFGRTVYSELARRAEGFRVDVVGLGRGN
jgi:K+-sensing histidine kinase KdpD